MPLRSSGCFQCRKRKIRCDETRPHCKRCNTHGVTCQGYRTDKPGGIEFQDQTTITVQRAQEHYKSKESSLVRKSSSSPTKSSDVEVLSASAGTGPMPWLGEELSQQLTMPIFPADMLSPAVMRSQLYSEFMDIYLPKNALLDHFSFFHRIATMPTEEPALLESLDALSLVTVGSHNKDKNLLTLSARTYGKALRSLAKAISAPAAEVKNDDLLATTTVLASCALYDEIGQQASGWGKHVKGCQQLIEARGPESIQSELSLLLFSNTRHGALVWAMIERKPPLMARPDWRAVAKRSPIQDSSTQFYDAAIQIPGLLQRHDQLVGDPNVCFPCVETPAYIDLTPSNVDNLLLDCERIETELRSWFADWQLRFLLSDHYTDLTGSILYSEKPIDDFPTFTALCANRTIDTAFMFPSFPVAYLASLYWMGMHYLRTTMQSLHKLRHDLDDFWYPDLNRIVTEDELLEYALNLCKCIPFFCEPISSNTGQVGIFLPMRTAAIYFTSHGHWMYAKWIGAVRNSIFVKGLSPPNVNDPPGTLSNLDKARCPPKPGPDVGKALFQCNELHSEEAAKSGSFGFQSPSGFSSMSSSVGSYS